MTATDCSVPSTIVEQAVLTAATAHKELICKCFILINRSCCLLVPLPGAADPAVFIAPANSQFIHDRKMALNGIPYGARDNAQLHPIWPSINKSQKFFNITPHKTDYYYCML
ncbi:hypothetical protein [Fodinicurvata sp. EGI_FJ10296]|uniref:hypothetical protein n=1 Tax=Fodinicurvata sp. EGI_FJ10296 TaxID=3231908 RepID=UPI00345309C4